MESHTWWSTQDQTKEKTTLWKPHTLQEQEQKKEQEQKTKTIAYKKKKKGPTPAQIRTILEKQKSQPRKIRAAFNRLKDKVIRHYLFFLSTNLTKEMEQENQEAAKQVRSFLLSWAQRKTSSHALFILEHRYSPDAIDGIRAFESESEYEKIYFELLQEMKKEEVSKEMSATSVKK